MGRIITNTGVSSVSGKSGAVRLIVGDVYGAAPIDSPELTGEPIAPTPLAGDNSGRIATTEFVIKAVENASSSADASPGISNSNPAAETVGASAAMGVSTLAARSDHVHAMPSVATETVSGFMSAVDKKKLNSIASSAAALTNVAAVELRTIASAGDDTEAARADHVHPLPSLQTLGAAAASHTHPVYAPLASPALTGTPTAPTAPEGTNTTQVATTGFVENAVTGHLEVDVTGLTTLELTAAQVSNPTLHFLGVITSNLTVIIPYGVKRMWSIYNQTTSNPAVSDFSLTVKQKTATGAMGAEYVTVSRNRSNLIYSAGDAASDGFTDFKNVTLTGTPTAPTAAAGTNNTQIATTAFVENAVVAAGGTTLTDEYPASLGSTALRGSATTAARADHVHVLPSLAALGAAASAHSHAIATTALPGFMSAADKTKLDAAVQLSSTTPLKLGTVAAVGVGTTSARTDHVHILPTLAELGAAASEHGHNAATTTASGFMSAADKEKLNGISEKAAALTTLIPNALAASGAAGTGTAAARSDHVHPLPTLGALGAAPQSHVHTLSNITGWPTAVSLTEVGYLDGVSAPIQTQLNAKATGTHTHSDYASVSHTHNYAAASHTHDLSNASVNYANSAGSAGSVAWTGVTGAPGLLGVGQKWVQFNSGRAFNTWYTNTTGAPIQVLITCHSTQANALFAIIEIENAPSGIVTIMELQAGTTLNYFAYPSFIVPSGAKYKATVYNLGVLLRWVELR